MSISKTLLRIFGWTVDITVPDYPKAIICVAPHTSNWDFIIGKLAYASVKRKAGFLMKGSWFFFPIGLIFRAMGGVPVPRKNGKHSLVSTLVKRYKEADKLVLAITPEGTRSLTTTWHTGFLHIAQEADIPILLGAIDFKDKHVVIERTFIPTGNIDSDMMAIKNYYRNFNGKYPEKFSVD